MFFITISAEFSQMPFGNFPMVLFFVLAAIAATDALFSIRGGDGAGEQRFSF